MLDRLRNNLPLKLLSLAIAVLGWTYLRLTPNPVIAARFVQQVTVPIATTGLRVDEIARMIGGVKVGEAARRAAVELLSAKK